MGLTAVLAGDLPLLFDSLWSAAVAAAHALRQRTAAACEVEVAAGADAVASAQDAWRSIERDGGAKTPFQTFAMARHLAEAHVARGEVPRVVTVRQDGRAAVVLPMVLTRWSGGGALRFLGDPLIQYGDAIATPWASSAALTAAWRAAADPAAATMVYLRKVRADAHLAPVLARETRLIGEQAAPFIDARRADRDAARQDREQRRLRRKLNGLGTVSTEHLRGPDALAAVDEALTMKREWLAARSYSSGVVGDPVWEQAIRAIAHDTASPLRVVRLSVDGVTAAVEIAMHHREHWCAFLGATAPAFARVGPGHAQMEEAVAHCRAAGIGTYDLLAPADAYKLRIADGHVVVRDHAAALNAWGWPGLWAAQSIPALKRLAEQLPPHWRRRMMAFRPL